LDQLWNWVGLAGNNFEEGETKSSCQESLDYILEHVTNMFLLKKGWHTADHIGAQQEGDKEFETVKENVLKEEEQSKILFWMFSHAASYQAHEHVVEIDSKHSSRNTKKIVSIVPSKEVALRGVVAQADIGNLNCQDGHLGCEKKGGCETNNGQVVLCHWRLWKGHKADDGWRADGKARVAFFAILNESVSPTTHGQSQLDKLDKTKAETYVQQQLHIRSQVWE